MPACIQQYHRLSLALLGGYFVVVVVLKSSMRSCRSAQRRTPMHASQVLRPDCAELRFCVSLFFVLMPTPLSNQLIYKARPKAARMPAARRPVP